MASLSQGDVKHNSFVDSRPQDGVTGIWVVTLQSASDTLVVPGLATTDGVNTLTAGISVSAGALTEGQTTVTVTGGSKGIDAVITTLHRRDATNNLSIDEDPT